VDPEVVRQTNENILKGIEKSVQIPGFRPGKAPHHLIKERYQEVINQKVMEKIIPEAYQKALEEHSLSPISEPVISEIEFTGDTLSYTVTFDVAPEVKIDSYSGLSLEKKELEITEEEVNRVLEEILKQNPRLQMEVRDIKVREKVKAHLRERLEYQARLVAVQEEDGRIVEQLLARAQVTPPLSLVKERTAELVRHHLKGITDFQTKTEEERKKVVEELFEKYKTQAEKEVKASFVLEEIARREKIEVSDSDVDRRIEIMARVAGREKEAYAAEFDSERRERLKNQMRIEKTLNLLKKRALLVEKSGLIKV